jgi:hemerythrin
MFPRWTQALSVHHPEMDAQHRQLFALAEALTRADAEGPDHVRRLIQQLIDYTYSHFAAEEEMLSRAGYPALAGHKQVHGRIFTAVDDIVTRHADLDYRLLAHELAVFVAEWLVRHIQQEDMAYGRFLSAQSLEKPAC